MAHWLLIGCNLSWKSVFRAAKWRKTAEWCPRFPSLVMLPWLLNMAVGGERRRNSQWSCKYQDDTKGADTKREQNSILECRREASKSFNDKKTDAINIGFKQHVMLAVRYGCRSVTDWVCKCCTWTCDLRMNWRFFFFFFPPLPGWRGKWQRNCWCLIER